MSIRITIQSEPPMARRLCTFIASCRTHSPTEGRHAGMLLRKRLPTRCWNHLGHLPAIWDQRTSFRATSRARSTWSDHPQAFSTVIRMGWARMRTSTAAFARFPNSLNTQCQGSKDSISRVPSCTPAEEYLAGAELPRYEYSTTSV